MTNNGSKDNNCALFDSLHHFPSYSQKSTPFALDVRILPKRTKMLGPVQRDAKEVLAEVLGKLTERLDAPAVSASAKENRRGNTVGPNRDRLTVGVDLGDRWSQYSILGLEGETLAEGQFADNAGRCKGVLPGIDSGADSDRSRNSLGLGAGRDHRVGTRGAGSQPAVDGKGRSVASGRTIALMPTGWLGWGGAVVASDYASQSRSAPGSGGVARRDALVSVRTELINTARGLVKSMGMEKYGHTTLLRQVKGVARSPLRPTC